MGRDSSLSFELTEPISANGAGPPSAPSHSAAVTTAGKQAGGFFLNGEVVGCACPQCGGPMSIRLWLMLGDCSLCGASLELTEEQEREIQRLLAEQSPAPAPPKTYPPKKPPAPSPPIQKVVSLPPPPRPKSLPAPTSPTPPPVQRQQQKQAAPAPPPAKILSPPIMAPGVPSRPAAVALQAPSAVAPSVATAPRHWDDDEPSAPWSWSNLAAWLASTIFHTILIMLLALWGWTPQHERPPRILLAATWGTAEKEGDHPNKNPDDERAIKIDSGKEETQKPDKKPLKPEQPSVPPNENAEERELREKVEELTIRPDELNALTLPPLEQLKSELARTDSSRMHQGRDPRVRSQLVEQEGGTPFTEAAVANGLRWLSRHQAEDGHWSLQNFARHGECDGRCRGSGNVQSNTGATGLALLPFLGAGQTSDRGIYQQHVERGLKWLIENQRENGDLRGQGGGNMYAHGIATIALCEAYALTEAEWLKGPAQKGIDFIVSAQDKSNGRSGRGGGWRYDPGQAGDTSVVGWQLMALQSARIAGLHVPAATFDRADAFLDGVQKGKRGGLYSYQKGREPEAAMIAEGLLCREYLGWPADHPGLQEGVDYLRNHLPDRDRPNIYYWYYGTQVLHHIGGEPWEEWNLAMCAALLSMQATAGHEAGSWEPLGGAIGGHDTQQGGRLYMTALAICNLEVYYRHLPIYRSVIVK